MKNTLKLQRLPSLDLALAAASDKERKNHANAKLYNEKDYADKMKGTVGRAKEILVIDGKIYYTFELSGSEKGMTLLNRLETLGAMMHNTPFYRVTLNGDDLEIQEDLRAAAEGKGIKAMPFSREMKARRKYAQWGWMMTTEDNVANAYIAAANA